MLSNIEEYYRPNKIDEAVNILNKGKGKLIPLAGGTSLPSMGNSKISGFVSLRDLGLRYISNAKSSIKIGSMTKIADVLDNKITSKFANGILFKACDKIGSTLNKNLITVGGNIVQIYKWSDLPVALLVLDTYIKIKGKKIRKVKIENFLVRHPKIELAYNEIVTEIEINKPKGKYGTDFIKFSKTEVDHALLDMAIYLKVEKSIIKEFRLAFGALKPLPFRAYEIEKFALNKTADEDIIDEISEKAAKILTPAKDFRVSIDYKRNLVKVLTKQAIMTALSQIK